MEYTMHVSLVELRLLEILRQLLSPPIHLNHKTSALKIPTIDDELKSDKFERRTKKNVYAFQPCRL